ncbi:hypothetical protein CK214_12195 [Mesorhizobium sp. WSM3882]|nr:hypothetical protein CK214_12195 [Mesorhizobium sp. WSM3882]TIS89036.1 MAG: ABC transporter substrate-binding protein [Mesorhizobium sp.]
MEQRSFRYADYGVPGEHTTLIVSGNVFVGANRQAAAAFFEGRGPATPSPSTARSTQATR